MAVGRGVVQAARQPAQFGGEVHADRDGRAVPPLVPLVLLDGVAERVAVVEDLPQPGLLQVRGDDLRLDPDRPLDQLGRVRAHRGAGGLGVGLDRVQDHRVGDEPRLDDLGQTGDVVVHGQRVQRGQVAQHTGRRVEGADQVLALGGVDAGLAADRRASTMASTVVGTAIQRTPRSQVAATNPARSVVEPPPTPTMASVRVKPHCPQRLPAVGGDLRGLGLLGVGHLDGDGLVPLLGRVGAQRLAGLGQRLRVDHGDPLGPVPDQPGQLAQQLPAHQHLVRVGARGAGDRDPGDCLLIPASTPVRPTPPA